MTRAPVLGVTEDQTCRQNALFDQPLFAVRVCDDGIQQHSALGEAATELGEMLGREHQRQGAQLPGPIAAFRGAEDVEGDLLLANAP